MADNSIASYGTLLQVDDGGGVNFTTIAEINDPGNPSRSANVVDTTVHNTGSPWRQRRPTLLTFDDLTLNVNWLATNATHSYVAGVGYLFNNRLQRTYRWVNNSDAGSDYHQFSAYVTKIQEMAPIDGVYKSTITITPSSAPTWVVT